MYANPDKCHLIINVDIALTIKIGEHEKSNNLYQVKWHWVYF